MIFKRVDPDEKLDRELDGVRKFLAAGKPDEREFFDAIEDVQDDFEEARELKSEARAALARAETEGAASAKEVLDAAKEEADKAVTRAKEEAEATKINAIMTAENIRKKARIEAETIMIQAASEEAMTDAIPFREHARLMADILYRGYQIVCTQPSQEGAEWGDEARKAKEKFDKLDKIR